MGSPEPNANWKGTQVENLCYRGEGTQVDNLCYERNTQVENLCDEKNRD